MVGKKLKHFEIEELLGKGGMGTVYRARDVRLNRRVAIKVLRSDLTSNRDRQKRFLQEARAASAVTHPAIAQIYDVDEVEGTTFIAMEYVEGQTISQLIAKRELDLLGSIEIAHQIAEGLSRAHEANIVHRDIKSDNIMVTRDGHAKLLDFGLAKLLDLQEESDIVGEIQDLTTRTKAPPKTLPGTILGTACSMSPEQARGRQVTQNSDIFSMGIVIYEMVTGELPFKGETSLDTMHAIAFDEVRPITIVRKNIPPELHRIISRCLRKKPEDRYQNASSLAADLKDLKRDVESGIERSVPSEKRIQGWLEWLKHSMPFGFKGIAIAAISLILVGLLIFKATSIGTLVGVAILALIVYRYVRNRKSRMLKRFTEKVSKSSEVRAIIVHGNQVTIIVDQALAKTYIRVNSLIDSVNKKIYFGSPIEAAVRDDLSSDEFQQVLRGPGVVYIRDDVVMKSESTTD